MADPIENRNKSNIHYDTNKFKKCYNQDKIAYRFRNLNNASGFLLNRKVYLLRLSLQRHKNVYSLRLGNKLSKVHIILRPY